MSWGRVPGRAACGWVVALFLVAMLPVGPTEMVRAQTVTTVAQLIAAVGAAGGQTATIDLIAGATYTLTAANNGAPGNENGLPLITGTLTINGHGAMIERSSAAGTPNFRLFMVSNGATLTLNGLTVRNGSLIGVAGTVGNAGGSAAGGAIFVGSNASLTVTNSIFAANSVLGGAGGKGSDGANNTAGFGGAGGLGATGGDGRGGAIGNFGTLVVRGSTFSGNTAAAGEGGDGGKGGNSNDASGGMGGGGGTGGAATGGALQTIGPLTVTNSTFSANSVTGGAGGNGGAAGIGPGGGVAGDGGNGGGGYGGGIYSGGGGSLTVTNSTLAADTARGGAGGTGRNPGATFQGRGGGVNNGGTGSFALLNTLLAANTADLDANCSGNALTGDGYNLEYAPSTSCNFAVNAQAGDPALGALANHGGATPTLALGPGSVAIGNGDHTICAGTGGAAPVGGVDQRGQPRPVGQCSIGAFEPQATPFPTLAALSPPSGSLAGGSSVALTGAGFASGATVTFVGAAAVPATFVSATKLTVTVPAHPAGAVEVIVTNPDAQAASLVAGYTFGVVTSLPVGQPTAPPSSGAHPLPPTRLPGGAPGGPTPIPLPPHR